MKILMAFLMIMGMNLSMGDTTTPGAGMDCGDRNTLKAQNANSADAVEKEADNEALVEPASN